MSRRRSLFPRGAVLRRGMALVYWRDYGLRWHTWRQAAEYGHVVSVEALDRQYTGKPSTLAKIHRALERRG
jgi:hypothetical protein